MASSSSLAVVVALHFTSKDFSKLFGQGAYAGNLGCILWWSTTCTCDHIFPSGSGSKHSFLAAASQDDPMDIDLLLSALSQAEIGNFGVIRTVGVLLVSPLYGWLLDRHSAYTPAASHFETEILYF